ncbi:MAG: intradiol ring-cleavage dioxygenase [Niabella sp.]|nr:MAG: intradiol ring-cleavage dioxygenase [Niabella sp.]
MKCTFPIITIFLFLFLSCNGRVNKQKIEEVSSIVGGGCEGCELMYFGMPKEINSLDTSIGWLQHSQKLIVTGKVFHLDGKTPAVGVVIYYWHTDEKGLYASQPDFPKEIKAHGELRGWVKTDELGNYSIYTSRPAAYPNDNIPQHIHLSIKEPQLPNEYFADLYFDDDLLYLSHKKKYGKLDRAGTELLRVVIDGKLQIAEHNIILGLNIPNYPKQPDAGNPIKSGLEIGQDQPSFMPFHAWGPDKGTQTCPVCKYGRYHGIIYFVGNDTNWAEIKSWLQFLELESERRMKYLKVYFVYGNSCNYNKSSRQKQLEQIGKELQIKNTALTFVPSFDDKETEANLNSLNPDAANTFIIFKHRNIVDKYINLKPSQNAFNLISNSLDKTQGDFFGLPEPTHE